MARIESSVTSLSWIPREAVRGATRLPFDIGFAHYDMPPPDTLEDLSGLLAADAIRFANELSVWIDVEDGRITGHGHAGKGHMGRTTVRLGGMGLGLAGVAFPDIRPEPEVTDTSVRFVQTAGGRTGLPAPRRVSRKPYVQISAPSAWTTLALTVHADGTSDFEVLGASSFPRHWIYGPDGKLSAKTGVIDFKTWYRHAFRDRTPWGEHDSPAMVTAVESALERELSRLIVGSNPPFKALREGETLVEQGDEGDELFLLFDGVLAVEIDGEVVTELGPGAILGEMALVDGGRRSATLRARTPCRIAAVPGDLVDKEALAELAQTRRGAQTGTEESDPA
jgi:Cyclic nucleotide-binding domain